MRLDRGPLYKVAVEFVLSFYSKPINEDLNQQIFVKINKYIVSSHEYPPLGST